MTVMLTDNKYEPTVTHIMAWQVSAHDFILYLKNSKGQKGDLKQVPLLRTHKY